MVFYFKSTVVDPPAEIYVGKHKEESTDPAIFLPVISANSGKTKISSNTGGRKISERLGIDNGLSQFHVDNLSSAHIYLRMKPGEDWASIPKALLEDCAQLTKANSIEGNKKDNVTVIYTPWSNLRKDNSMAVGQVSFHSPNAPNVRKLHIPQRDNAIVNRLNKTRTEDFPDLKAQRDQNVRQKKKIERLKAEEKKKQERIEQKERELQKWQKDHAYEELQREEGMKSNQDTQAGDWDDDFM